MPNLIDQQEFENGSNAASLTRIQVRKPKAPTDVLPATAKAGDITSRLAVLSAELDRELEAPTPASQIDVAPRKTNDRRVSPEGFSQTERRKTPERRLNTGWGQKKETPPDILSYWMDIRRGRRYPSWQTLEPEQIGKHWPNCILVHCNKDLGRLQVKYEFTNALRQAIQSDTPDEGVIERIEFTPMIVDWILGLSRIVASGGKPTHDTEYFPSFNGEFPLRVIALPLSDDLRSVDHVLCYIQQLK